VPSFITATSHTARDSFKREKMAGSATLKLMILGNWLKGDYLLSAVLSNDLTTTDFKIMARWKSCCRTVITLGLH
jgi:hypothetical protein